MKSFEETVEWLYSQLPIFQNQGKKALKYDLSNISLLCKHLDNPQNKFKSIHIAGTNGKGSVSHLVSAAMQAEGYKVGLHTSPHLLDFRERIKLNGQMCSKDFVIQFVKKHQAFLLQNNFSFFEITVAMAFSYFAEQQVDYAIIEVGMGGRLDSTNILQPIITAITNISLDHTDILGDTLEKIATEKAGIIKENTPVIIGKKQKETTEVYQHISQKNNSPLIFAEEENKVPFSSGLKGNYQKENEQTAFTLLKFLNVSEQGIKKGFENILTLTDLKGRWHILSQNPMIITDTGHNSSAIQWIIKQLESCNTPQLHLVLGFMKDKDISSIMPLLPKDALFYFAPPNTPRSLSKEQLKDLGNQYNLQFSVFESVSLALKQAKNNAKETDVIFVGGSTFVVAEVV